MIGKKRIAHNRVDFYKQREKIREIKKEITRLKHDYIKSGKSKVEARILKAARQKLEKAKATRNLAYERLKEQVRKGAFDKLTDKQKEWIKKVFVEEKTQTQAAREAYGTTTDRYAQTKGSLLARSPSIINAVEELYKEAGMTRNLIAKAMVEAMHARKSYFDKRSGTLVEADIADHKIRLQAASQGAKIFGDERRAREGERPQVNINMKINAREHDSIEKGVAEFLKQKLGKKGSSSVKIVDDEETEEEGKE